MIENKEMAACMRASNSAGITRTWLRYVWVFLSQIHWSSVCRL